MNTQLSTIKTAMKYLVVMILFCLCCQAKNDGLISLLKHHQQTKENFSVQDAYKLMYQGVFGVAHILDKPEFAKRYLISEIESVESSDSEPLIETISVSGEIVRINLRPYKKSGRSVEKLFEIMVRSAGEINGTISDFLQHWEEFKKAFKNGKLNFNVKQLEKFEHKMIAENYPAVHHSLLYREANKPAYRVVKTNVFLEYFPNETTGISFK